ncbi:MAG: YtxH domain-containing protein [Dehalococcoidia bacterium]
MRFLVGLILGLAVGAAVGLLRAPQRGDIMRQLIAYKVRERWRARQERQAEEL